MDSTINKSKDVRLGNATGKAIALMNELRAVGGDIDLDLPRIIFVGKQSAGKSSLVEALTGVRLPRSHRTCTRCPIEVTTRRSTSSSWVCEISMRMTQSGGIGPTIVHEFKTLVDENEDIAKAIAEAQTNLLSLSSPSDDSMKLFSSDVVSVQISGPDLDDLALIDLPGLIQSQENKENEVYITAVENLVRSYMEQPNTCIVACISSDEDIENQKIFSMARKSDPEGNRTIGVLTKPDKVEKGLVDDIVSILQGKSYALLRGYFVIRSPNKDELDQINDSCRTDISTYLQGREIENLFFRENLIGKKIFEMSPDRCGTLNLRKQLSNMLKKMIDCNIPYVLEMAQKLVEQSKEELHVLGTCVSREDSRRVLNDIIREYGNIIGDYISSSGSHKSLWQEIRKVLQSSKRNIQNATPSFDVGGKLVYCSMLDEVTSDSVTDPIVLNVSKVAASELKRVNSPIQRRGGISWSLQFRKGSNGTSICVFAHDLPSGAKSVHVKYKIVPSGFSSAVVREHDDPDCGPSNPVERLITSHVGNKSLNPSGNVLIEVYISILGFIALQESDVMNLKSNDNTSKPLCHIQKPYNVPDVKNFIRYSTRREINLPGPASYATSEELIKGSIVKWVDPAHECVNDIHHVLLKILCKDSANCLVNKVVSAQFPRLRRTFLKVISDHLDKLKADTLLRINEVLEMENALYTSNNIVFSNTRRQFQKLVRSYDNTQIADKKTAKLTAMEENQLNAILGKLGRSKDDLDLIPTLNALNEEALDVIAGVLSYFFIKEKVLVDSLHQHIIYHLVDKYAKEAADGLIKGTGLMSEGSDKLHELFAETEEAATKREKLKSDLMRRKQCLSLIENYF